MPANRLPTVGFEVLGASIFSSRKGRRAALCEKIRCSRHSVKKPLKNQLKRLTVLQRQHLISTVPQPFPNSLLQALQRNSRYMFAFPYGLITIPPVCTGKTASKSMQNIPAWLARRCPIAAAPPSLTSLSSDIPFFFFQNKTNHILSFQTASAVLPCFIHTAMSVISASGAGARIWPVAVS